MKLDALDTKILSVLDKDARLTDSEIGKKTRASKQVIRYRLKKLQEDKIIENYYTMVDVGQLGFDSYYLFVQLTGLNSKQENELYQKILQKPYISWLITGVGRWDAVILFCAKSIAQFNNQLIELKILLGKNLHEHTYVTLIQAEHIGYKFVNPDKHLSLKTTPKDQIFSLNNIDKKMLKTINQDARMQVTEIAENISEPIHVVHYHLKKLKKEGLIKGFKPKINIQKLGLQWHLLLIKFNSVSYDKIKDFLEYCNNQKAVYYATNTVGNYDVMLDLHVKDTEEFREFLFNIKNRFQEVILLYESIFVFEELLITYIPEVVLDQNNNLINISRIKK